MSRVKDNLGYDLHTVEGVDFFSRSAKTVALVESFFEGKLTEHDRGSRGAQEHRGTETPNFPNFPPGTEFMDFMDDVWMQDNLGASDYQGMVRDGIDDWKLSG